MTIQSLRALSTKALAKDCIEDPEAKALKLKPLAARFFNINFNEATIRNRPFKSPDFTKYTLVKPFDFIEFNPIKNDILINTIKIQFEILKPFLEIFSNVQKPIVIRTPELYLIIDKRINQLLLASYVKHLRVPIKKNNVCIEVKEQALTLCGEILESSIGSLNSRLPLFEEMLFLLLNLKYCYGGDKKVLDFLSRHPKFIDYWEMSPKFEIFFQVLQKYAPLVLRKLDEIFNKFRPTAGAGAGAARTSDETVAHRVARLSLIIKIANFREIEFNQLCEKHKNLRPHFFWGK